MKSVDVRGDWLIGAKGKEVVGRFVGWVIGRWLGILKEVEDKAVGR